MEKKESPKETGMSRITGKIVKVRHATEADMGFIETKKAPGELMNALNKACRIGGKHNAVLMVYEKGR
jgi:hypothetical protein